ncbi:MAG: hypothetical protein ACFHWX_00500 [Bacteroidota bacterium]
MKKLYAILIFMIMTTFCHGQDEPLSLANAIFAKEKFPNLDKHVTGEYKGRPNGTDLPTNVTTDFLLLGQYDKTAVVNITITDSAGQAFDGYLHFVKEEVWKITAFRALALTGIIGQIKEMLENMTESQIDSIIERSKNDTKGFALFKTREEYEYTLGNARLTLASDKELIDHFKKNELDFEKLKDDLIANGIMSIKSGLQDMADADRFRKRLNKLLLNTVGPDVFNGSSNNLNFNIGGMVDNTVGYLFIADKEKVPKMNPNSIIMIRELGNGWYLFKTT